MSDNPAVVEAIRLAERLRNAAYRNGNIDAEERWSDKKYQEVSEASNAAFAALLEHLRRQSNLLLRARKAIYDMSNDRELMTDGDAELLNEIDSNDLGSAR